MGPLLQRERMRHAVYLVDPGPGGAALIMLLERLTGLTTAECVEITRRVPSLVWVCDDEAEARAIVARFRELRSLAVVRPAHQPLAEGEAPPDLRRGGQRAFDAVMVALGLIQIGIGYYWWHEGRLLAGIAGALLGLVVVAYFVWRFPRD